MAFLTNIAIIAFLFTLAVGVFSLVREQGYSFDLRRRSNRRQHGGRRQDDALLDVR